MDVKEISVLSYLQDVTAGKSEMAPTVIYDAASALVKVMNDRFNTPKTGERNFRIRMSNLGKPLCQLQMDRRYGSGYSETPQSTLNFLIGDITEVVFSAILKSAFDDFGGEEELRVNYDGVEVVGHTDVSTNKETDDIKSASGWAFDNKFINFDTLKEHDAFGYIVQAFLYDKGGDKPFGGWWVINKVDGTFKYIRYSPTEAQKAEIEEDIKHKVKVLSTPDNEDEPIERQFEAQPETFRRVPSGNKIISKDMPCFFCNHQKRCWPEAQMLPSKMSGAKNKPQVLYTYVAPEKQGD